MSVVAEGVDYSSTANADWNGLARALKAEGKTFVGRYAVRDKSPEGRGITHDEYWAMTSNGIEVFLYYEETEAWMLGGYAAGVRAGTRVLEVLRDCGMPVTMPVYYSHDVDPQAQEFAAIDECLRGAASIVGPEAVGFYGGWAGIDHVMSTQTAKWFCQTIAWEYGRGLHPGIHLHQYGFNAYFYGTNCDLVAALQPHYGQASDFTGDPVTPKHAKKFPPALKNNEPFAHIDKDGILWLPLHKRQWIAHEDAPRKQRARDSADDVGNPIPRKGVGTFIYSVHMTDGSTWFVSRAGTRCRASHFVATS